MKWKQRRNKKNSENGFNRKTDEMRDKRGKYWKKLRIKDNKGDKTEVS